MLRRLPYLLLMATLLGGPVFGKKAIGVSLDPEPEQWKGKPYDTQFQVGTMAGLGLLGGSAGFSWVATVAYKIAHTGFLDDVNDQVYLEIVGGPLFMTGNVGMSYGAHMRWDFHKNEIWSFYATGGFGGAFAGPAIARTHAFYPRFAVGTLWNLFDTISFRGELSHEFTGVGIVFLL